MPKCEKCNGTGKIYGYRDCPSSDGKTVRLCDFWHCADCNDTGWIYTKEELDSIKEHHFYKCPNCACISSRFWDKKFLIDMADPDDEPNYVGYPVKICTACGTIFDPDIKGVWYPGNADDTVHIYNHDEVKKFFEGKK